MEYHADGTFVYELDGTPVGAGAYLVYEDVLVGWFEAEQAMAVYRFKQDGPNVIEVTSLVYDDEGRFVPADTVRFTCL